MKNGKFYLNKTQMRHTFYENDLKLEKIYIISNIR